MKAGLRVRQMAKANGTQLFSRIDEISRCDRPRFPGLRSAASWAAESRPGWALRNVCTSVRRFLTPKGTDSIARGKVSRTQAKTVPDTFPASGSAVSGSSNSIGMQLN